MVAAAAGYADNAVHPPGRRRRKGIGRQHIAREGKRRSMGDPEIAV
jgi:hypothetical protein